MATAALCPKSTSGRCTRWRGFLTRDRPAASATSVSTSSLLIACITRSGPTTTSARRYCRRPILLIFDVSDETRRKLSSSKCRSSAGRRRIGPPLALQHDLDALHRCDRLPRDPRRLILPLARGFQQDWIVKHLHRPDDARVGDVAALVNLQFQHAGVYTGAKRRDRKRERRHILLQHHEPRIGRRCGC